MGHQVRNCISAIYEITLMSTLFVFQIKQKSLKQDRNVCFSWDREGYRSIAQLNIKLHLEMHLGEGYIPDVHQVLLVFDP